jgi:hypothetical protein
MPRAGWKPAPDIGDRRGASDRGIDDEPDAVKPDRGDWGRPRHSRLRVMKRIYKTAVSPRPRRTGSKLVEIEALRNVLSAAG